MQNISFIDCSKWRVSPVVIVQDASYRVQGHIPSGVMPFTGENKQVTSSHVYGSVLITSISWNFLDWNMKSRYCII